MNDEEIVEQINTLAAEELELEEAHVGDEATDAQRARLRQIEVTLDQLWDTLRQRRARRSAGHDPDAVAQRSADTVEGYLQ